MHAITKTLGYHVDSPSLAPFLGRAPKNRRINAYDEDQDIDIFAAGASEIKPAWRKSYAPRNKSRAALDEAVEPPEASGSERAQEAVAAAGPSVNIGHTRGSRFHVLARVSVKDISLWVPPGKPVSVLGTRLVLPTRPRASTGDPACSYPLVAFSRHLAKLCELVDMGVVCCITQSHICHDRVFRCRHSSRK